MAVYKVIQNVEAEDKIVGSLTLKQFIYMALAIALAFVNFKILVSFGLGPGRWVLILFFGMPMLLFGILAVPFGQDQPTELWIMSHLHFLFSAHKRIWNQDGMIQNVSITAPKEVAPLTKNITQPEVKSRLKALADLLDSRGWSAAQTPAYQSSVDTAVDSDRLVSSDSLAMPEPIAYIKDGDDVFEEETNPTAQRFGALVKEAEQTMKQELAKKLSQTNSSTEPAISESQPLWGVKPITPKTTEVVKPDLPADFVLEKDRELQPAEKPSEDLNERVRAAEASLHARHPIFASESPQTVRPQASQLKQNLAESGNFSVSTLSSLASAHGEQQTKPAPI